MKKALLFFSPLIFLIVTASACEKGLAHGDNNAVIVVAPADWWPEVRDSVFAALAPDVFTLRNERTFRLAYQDPAALEWSLSRMFREEVVFGNPEDPWVSAVLETLDDTVTVAVPGIVEAENVWARNQKVTVILVDTSQDIPSQVFPLLGRVHEILEKRFKEGAAIRMFVSGRNSALADTLQRMAGFSILLPAVYQWGAEDSLYIFRNDNPRPADLIRQFAVNWRTPVPQDLPADSLMDWKERLSDESYAYPQVVEREGLRTRLLGLGDMRVREFRGTWSNPPDSQWPAAGPFILWTVECPLQDRLYLIDAWLYAPDRDKWEYILQLETVLGSFRCGPGGGS
jgi:hypothetical protein